MYLAKLRNVDFSEPKVIRQFELATQDIMLAPTPRPVMLGQDQEYYYYLVSERSTFSAHAIKRQTNASPQDDPVLPSIFHLRLCLLRHVSSRTPDLSQRNLPSGFRWEHSTLLPKLVRRESELPLSLSSIQSSGMCGCSLTQGTF